MPTWDETWMEMVHAIAKRSKDSSRQVGCIIVGRDNIPLVNGYNGFPRGADDTDPNRHARPTKYKWTIHDAGNAICNAAKLGIALRGASLYTNTFPCSGCAGLITQAGIAEVVTPVVVSMHKDGTTDWEKDRLVSQEIFAVCGVRVRIVEERHPEPCHYPGTPVSGQTNSVESDRNSRRRGAYRRKPDVQSH